MEKPTIAAVNGICAGAGLSFALLCDIRIASEKSKFSAIWVRMGLLPDVGATCLLPRTVGMDRALKLCFTGEIIDAADANSIGLVTEVVPHDLVMSTAHGIAKKIAAVAIELAKRGIYRAMGGNYAGQLDY